MRRASRALESYLLIFLCVGLIFCDGSYSAHLRRIADEVNSKELGWKANVAEGFLYASESSLKRLAGSIESPRGFKIKMAHPDLHKDADVPDSFDSRIQWPSCATIGQVYDQANCAADFAIVTATSMQDRMCIASDQQFQVKLSMEDILECCSHCGNGCLGGSPDEAWNHVETNGVCTGGEYYNEEWCKPYFFAPCAHFGPSAKYPPCGTTAYAPACYFHCPNRYFSIPYAQDTHYAQSSQTLLPNQIQAELVKNGPLHALMDVYDDFFTYQFGVYAHSSTKKIGSLSVKLIGYGTDGGKPYWLAVNSWNDSWGMKGLFKIARGSNECNIEKNVIAGKVGVKGFRGSLD